MTLKGTFCFTNNDKHAKISKKSLVRQSIGGPCSQKMWIEQNPEKKCMNGNSVEVLLEALLFAGIKYTHSISKRCTTITTFFLSKWIVI